MEIKDVKIGDKVQLRKDVPDEELISLANKHMILEMDLRKLQRRGEVTVEGIQEGIPGKKGDDWDSITLEEIGCYWPIELFEPVSKPNVIKSKEDQVQEDILTLKGIAERYGIQDSIDGIIEWLCDFGQKYLQRD